MQSGRHFRRRYLHPAHGDGVLCTDSHAVAIDEDDDKTEDEGDGICDCLSSVAEWPIVVILDGFINHLSIKRRIIQYLIEVQETKEISSKININR